MNPNGVWSLKIFDRAGNSTSEGTLNGWSVSTTTVNGGLWSLTGNSGNSSANFIGTTDNRPLKFKVNNQNAGFIDPANNNTVFGLQSSVYNTSGSASNTTGTNNTAIGAYALDSNTIGTDNTAIGMGALRYNTTGGDNIASGQWALSNNTTGYQNTAFGNGALTYNSTGFFNTALGNYAGVGVNSGNLTNTTAIGANVRVSASNTVEIGNSSVVSIGGWVPWTSFSDARIKDNIQYNVPGLSFIRLLKPATYRFNVNKENELRGIKDSTNWTGKYDIEKIAFTGFLAQDVDAAARKVGYDFSGVDKNGILMGLRYSEFVVPLVKAVQELSSENEQLRKSLQAVHAKLQELESRVNQLIK